MAIAHYFTCENCGEQTIVKQIQEVTKEKHGWLMGHMSFEIERGCYHVCIDDQLKNVVNPIRTR